MAFFRASFSGAGCLPFPYSGQPGKRPSSVISRCRSAFAPRGRRPLRTRPIPGNYLRRAPITTTMSLSIRPAAWIAASIARLRCVLHGGIRQLLLAIEIEYVRKEGLRKLFLAPFPFWPCTTRRSDSSARLPTNARSGPILPFVILNGKLADLATKARSGIGAASQALEGNMKGAAMKQFFGVCSCGSPGTASIPKPSSPRGRAWSSPIFFANAARRGQARANRKNPCQNQTAKLPPARLRQVKQLSVSKHKGDWHDIHPKKSAASKCLKVLCTAMNRSFSRPCRKYWEAFLPYLKTQKYRKNRILERLTEPGKDNRIQGRLG